MLPGPTHGKGHKTLCRQCCKGERHELHPSVTVPSRGGSNPTRIPAPLPEAVEAVLPPLQRTGAGSGSEGTNLVPLRQVAGNVNCMVRVVQKVDAVVSGLSTN